MLPNPRARNRSSQFEPRSSLRNEAITTKIQASKQAKNKPNPTCAQCDNDRDVDLAGGPSISALSDMTGCPFCNIAEHFPPSESPSANYELISPSAFVVLSTPLCLAFLDIMPLSPGHLLVTTRKHHEKVSDVTEEESRELGMWLSKLSRVLASVTGVFDWNIVQNNGAAAAQVVQHVHFHIIPRPALTPELRNKSFTMFGRGQRSEIDDDKAAELAKNLREGIIKEMERIRNREKL